MLPLVLDGMAPCPINPSFSVLGYDQASLCLAHAFLSPWGGRGNDIKKKKTEMRMLVHCRIWLAFSISMLDVCIKKIARFFSFVALPTSPADASWFAKKKKKHRREMQLLRRLTVGNGRTRCYFPVELYSLFMMD